MPSYECAPGAARRPLGTTYARRQPEKSVLHEVLGEHLESFLEELACEGRYLPRYVVEELRRFLPCGLLSEGFARVQCRTCGDELLVAFSCKGRAFCPSCCARRMSDTAAHLVDRVLPEAPYRQWVLSYPYPVKLALARDGKAASQSCKILVSEIFRMIEEINKEGTTILLVEQNASMALALADRAYVLEAGEIALEGKACDLQEDPKVRAAYLGAEAGVEK